MGGILPSGWFMVVAATAAADAAARRLLHSRGLPALVSSERSKTTREWLGLLHRRVLTQHGPARDLGQRE